MFNDPNKDQRKYQCFVCALEHTDFEEFKAHIKKEHVEGTDYIVCPLERCQAPVRDMRLHFKVKHVGTPLPKHGLMKATLWRDIKANGKVKTKRKFKEGYHHSTKMQRDFYHRSGYEKTVYELLDSWNEVLAYDVEPFNIPYIHEGEVHQYKPDIFVVFIDDRKEIWEIKPSNQTSLQKNKDKWVAARAACDARGWGFKVVVEKDMKLLAETVKRQHLD